MKKAFVDPEEQEIGELDKYLMDNTACLPKEDITLLQKIGKGNIYISFLLYLKLFTMMVT